MIEQIGGDFFQWLRGFYYVAKRGSVTQAALEMGRNQPTVSHQIKCLENEFGVSLFDRSSGRMELTPEGEILLDRAISLFEIVQEMKGEVKERSLEPRGKVIIAATHAIIHFFLPPFVQNFRKAHPHVDFDLEGGGLEMILAKVDSAEADFGIAHMFTVPDGFVYHNLFKTNLVLIAPKKNPFPLTKNPSLREISRVPFVFFPGSSTLVPYVQQRFAKEGLKLHVVLELNNYDSVKKYVSLGLGVSILDDYALTPQDEKRLEILELNAHFEARRYGLIMRKRKYLSPAAKAFARMIQPKIDFRSSPSRK